MEMNTGQLAAEVNVTRVTLWSWQKSGAIPAPTRRGRQKVYSPAAVEIARSLAGGAR